MTEVHHTDNLIFLAVVASVLPLFPLALLAAGKRTVSGWLPTALIAVSFVLSMLIFCQVWNKPVVHVQWQWFQVGNVKFTAGILLNNLSVLMLSLVSGIALLVHVYSMGYMKGDGGLHRYWSYLGLFCFSMLALVIADSLFLIYIFWELVGFSSYLLIGFWYTRESAAQAAKKAFIINRIGDLGFLTGLAIIYTQFGTFDLVSLFGGEGLITYSNIVDGQWIGSIGTIPAGWYTVAGLAFVVGALAKSAQFPFFTWLPDAMEGPTAVSSLIHAATMVAAGVFLLGRVFPLFDMLTLNVILSIGVLTAFIAATAALAQNDIKRILAYSTISQLGYMVVAMGMGLYSESIFHLATHAFFKCLLFLAAGSVIHEVLHYKESKGLDFDHQDIREMGGLGKSMPLTMVVMCVAAAALAGLPFTSGYLSKDAILVGSFEWAAGFHGFKKWVPYLLVLVSWMTTFYIFRLIFKVFFGPAKLEGLHEPTRFMTFPKVALALLCMFFLFSLNPFGYQEAWIIGGFGESGILTAGHFHILVPIVVSGVALIIVLWAWWLYAKRQSGLLNSANPIYRFSEKAWYFDELYQFVFVAGVSRLAKWSALADRLVFDGLVNLSAVLVRTGASVISWFDRSVVDGVVNGAGDIAMRTGNLTRRAQSGKIQHYMAAMILILGLIVLIMYLI